MTMSSVWNGLSLLYEAAKPLGAKYERLVDRFAGQLLDMVRSGEAPDELLPDVQGLLRDFARAVETAEGEDPSELDETWHDELKGGRADRDKPGDFDPAAVAKGAGEEHGEHTSSWHKAAEIAMDHLHDDPAYYDKED